MTTQALTIYKGTTFLLVVNVTDSDGAAYPLVGGWSVYAEIRRNPDGAVIHDMVPTITGAATGEISATIARTDTAEFDEGLYEWDLLIESPSGDLLGPIIGGAVKVVTPITQPA